MKRINLLLILLLNSFIVFGSSVNDEQMKVIGKEFRKCHPYGFQTVGLKHVGDDCVFVISEPSYRVAESSLQLLFAKYQGRTISQTCKFGYDGWMKDVIGTIHFQDETSQDRFKKELFEMLYGTAYKAEYTDLDNLKEQTYYSSYKLNYSISAAEISKWIIDDKEVFVDNSGKTTIIQEEIRKQVGSAGKIVESKDQGFIAWVIKPNDLRKNDPDFLVNARKFTLDSDLILGALGNIGGNVAIIARKRIVPIDILPPLRIETIELLCNTRNENLAQSYERYHVFAGKTKDKEDVAPIYLSDELWNTEYGNLLNVTDQMLKSWSENGRIEYKEFEYPKPIDWAFERGVVRDLKADELTYNWNTAGAGYVLQGDAGLDVFAVNRTGSLPVSYIPSGMEGQVDESINEAEELAYDFFSGLNNPELVRVVQYATLYQIVQNFYKEPIREDTSNKFRYDDYLTNLHTLPESVLKGLQDAQRKGISADSLISFVRQRNQDRSRASTSIYESKVDDKNVIPDYAYFETFVEKLLHIVDSPISQEAQQTIKEGLGRFIDKNVKNDLKIIVSNLIDGDPYGEFDQFLSQKYSQSYVDSVLNSTQDAEVVKSEYNEYLTENVKIVKAYLENYRKRYGSFPFKEAAHYIVCPRDVTSEIKKMYEEYEQKQRHLSDRIDNYNSEVKRYNQNEAGKPSSGIFGFSLPKDCMDKELAAINKEEAEFKKLENQLEKKISQLSALSLDNDLQQAMGTLNWLLTNPQKYNEPFGEFFSEHFINTGSVWLKSPIITCSYNGSGYGGHNLDSHVTPIKFAEKLPAGKCRVSKIGGKHVISVSKENWNRITPSVLRRIERRNLSGLVDLPKAPIIRSKKILASVPEGPRLENNETPIVALTTKEKGILINNQQCNTVDELFDNVNKGNGSVYEVQMREYSEREVLVSINKGPERILERSSRENFSLSKYDNERIETEELVNGNVVVKIPQREETISTKNCSEASFGIEIPRKYSEVVKSAVIRIFNSSKEKINNLFKFRRALKIEIGDDMPDFEPVLIQNEIMNTNQVRIIIDDEEDIYMVAA